MPRVLDMAALGTAWGRWFFRHFVRPPSPPPVYDKGGNRLNTRDVRIRRGHRARRAPQDPCFELGTYWNHWNHGTWFPCFDFQRVPQSRWSFSLVFSRKAMTAEYNRLIRPDFGVFCWEVRCTKRCLANGLFVVQRAQVHDQACRWIPATC